jgi:hypothetical protein
MNTSTSVVDCCQRKRSVSVKLKNFVRFSFVDISFLVVDESNVVVVAVIFVFVVVVVVVFVVVAILCIYKLLFNRSALRIKF